MQVQSLSAAPQGRVPVRIGRKTAVRLLHSQPETDIDLMAAIAQGDRAAFQHLFLSFGPRVKSYLIRLGAPAAGAEELTQDAMLAVWRRASAFDPKRAGVSTWIFVIARNCWIDRLRREKVELAYRQTNDEPDEVEAEGESSVMRAQVEARVQAAMQNLSEDQREVVRLSFFEEKSHSEIAADLKQPLGTVKSRLRLAMAKLRAQLEGLA